jgi:glycosidase
VKAVAARLTILGLTSMLLCSGEARALGAATAKPEVLKVEPPSFWPGHSINPVRLLVRGRTLGGAVVTAEAGSGLEVGLTSVNVGGTYLFVDVSIDQSAAPGRRRLRIATAGGIASLPFEVLAPLPPEGRFQGFSSDDVFYLAMPDRFANGDPANDDPGARGLLDRKKARYYHGGDFAGLVKRLPYLKDLGVTALWLNPWYDNANRLNERETYDGQAITDYHGYGAVDFYAVDEHLGDLAGLKALVDDAHAHGIKVVQDQVANHSGPYHPWVQDPPTPTWLNGSGARHLANTWQTWTLMDPYANAEVRKTTLDGWFIDILPDLNQDDPEVARYVIQNTLWWVGVSGLDGIRQDTLPYVPRRFWRDWMAAIKKEHPRLKVVGELFDGDPAMIAFFEGGRAQKDGVDTGLDALFDFPLFFKVREAFAQGKNLREVANLLARDHLYRDPASFVTFLGLHDVPRFMNEPGATADGLKLAFTFLLTARGTPLVYYGDEIAMPGGGDPDNRRDFPGGFPGDPRNAFERTGRTAVEEDVHAHVRTLSRARAELSPLRRGQTVNLFVSEQAWAYARMIDEETVVVALNNATGPVSFDLAARMAALGAGAVLRDRLSPRTVRVEGGRLRFDLGARSGLVLAPERWPAGNDGGQ